MASLHRAGQGKPGYCKLCSFANVDLQAEFDRRVLVWTPKQLNEWLEERDTPRVSRPTIYNHREHVRNPKDRLVNAVERHRQEQGVQPATVSEEDFLQAIINVGAQRVAENPEEVTIDQALKAAQIRGNLAKKGNDINVLVAIMTEGVSQIPTIEGEVKVL